MVIPRRLRTYIADGIRETENLTTEILDIEEISLEELESKLITADGIIIGSPTINQNTLLPVYKLFSLINPIRDKGKLGASFGSYGWSGESPKIILENLRLLKLKIFEDTAQFKFSPAGDKELLLKDFGRRYAVKFKEECGMMQKSNNISKEFETANAFGILLDSSLIFQTLITSSQSMTDYEI